MSNFKLIVNKNEKKEFRFLPEVDEKNVKPRHAPKPHRKPVLTANCLLNPNWN